MQAAHLASCTMADTQPDGVFGLVSALCESVAGPHAALRRRLRAHAYRLLLQTPGLSSDPLAELLAHMFVMNGRVRYASEHGELAALRALTARVQREQLCSSEAFESSLRLLVALRDTAPKDHAEEMYQRPFTLGLLDEMLPRLPREEFGSPVPYQYYPAHLFELPYSLDRQNLLDRNKSSTYTNYTVESFHSKSSDCGSTSQGSELRPFYSPMCLDAQRSALPTQLESSLTLEYPRLLAPRDLLIPKTASEPNATPNFFATTVENGVKKMFRAARSDISNDICKSVDIWELASVIDKNIPDDIWDIASKLPAREERRLIAMSPREVTLWREVYSENLNNMDVVSEKQFIRHVMYLTIGIESSSFPWSPDHNSFVIRPSLSLEGVSEESLHGYVAGLVSTGSCYRRLYGFAFKQSLEEQFQGNGYIFEAAKNVVRRFLLSFRLKATEIYEKCFRSNGSGECLPTLLQIIYHMEPHKYEIETVASIYKVIDADSNATIPNGVNLMSYLYNEISLITHNGTCCNMFTSLYSICKVYFKFIERFIFDGELEDRHNEFFIRKDLQYVHSHSKRYWDKGFFITDNEVVPEFLKCLAKYILLCGKSFRLLKLCNPNDPLVLLISTDHPSIKCCTNFEEISRQQQILDLYRTRCLFVSGEPVTFDQIMLKKEAEKKAFTEMASMKQAETLEKIVAERKRLTQLIIAGKQHSLRVLEAAIAETKAAKNRSRRRERVRTDLETAVEKARDEADAILKDEERNKIMEYYSKLNLEVEKRKVHTEWKIKRLQLDQTRMQLLSTEERNLKREKLELEHFGNEGSLSNSIYSSDSILVVKDHNLDEFNSDATMVDLGGCNRNLLKQAKTDNAKCNPTDSSETYVIFDNAAKTINEKRSTDNVTIELLDVQGNIMPTELCDKSAKSVDGKDSHEIIDNSEFIKNRLEALKNKQKILAHDFRQPDSENNYSSISNILNIEKSTSGLKFVDSENNLSSLDGKCYFDCNEAFIEARRNKSDHSSLPKTSKSKSQSTEFLSAVGSNENLSAHTEAKRNKLKVLSTENDNFNLISKSTGQLTPAENNMSQTEASVEAKRNKTKVLGRASENVAFNRSQSVDYLTGAQKEAVINKNKVLGTEYNLELKATFKKPLNIAQEEAVRNKRKILSSEYGMDIENTAKQDSNRRAALTLDLRKPVVTRTQERIILGITPTTGGLTPGDFFPELDLETPTTAEVPFGGPQTADVISPIGDSENVFNRSDKEYLSSDGFKFPSVMLLEENPETEEDTENIAENIPCNSILDSHQSTHFSCINSSLWNFDESYNFDSFDPFGVKGATIESKGHLSSKMNMDMKKSCYTNPEDLMKEASKKPYHDIFKSQTNTEEETDLSFTQVNIATLTACFQRSVMLPLSYQLEMVNNSILTHYLMDLDIYEHLKSLKDYFFLMDGEFSKTICQNLFRKLVKTINPEELLNFATLHSILDKALVSSIANLNKFSENLSFSITEPPLSFHHSSPDVLQCLSLTYSVSWPMNIILSAEALARYAKVFQFLLKMRRISWILGQDFEVLKLPVKLSNRDSRALLNSPQYNALQVNRHMMSSLIRALDTYILTTCVQSSWSELERELKRARTLDDLYDCHVVYVKRVLFRCLLNKRSTPVMKLLNDVFTVILRFSHVLKTRPWMKNEVTGHYVHPCFAQLEELFHLFEKLTRHLHKTVTRLMECGYQPHLVELLTMINLNGYYDPLAKGYAEKSMEPTP